MSRWISFIFGLLMGWLVQSVFLRRRHLAIHRSPAHDQHKVRALESELRELREANTSLLKRANELERQSISRQQVRALKAERDSGSDQHEAAQFKPDSLEKIKGIGPVIAKKLNNYGVYTFDQLSTLTPEKLRELLGNVIRGPLVEDAILRQARQLTEKRQNHIVNNGQ